GRVAGASLSGLFVLGRAVTFASGLLTTLVLGWYAGRRYGKGAGAVAAVLSLGSAPMVDFGTMVRPDMMADLFGIAGFLLLGRRGRASVVAGGLLIVLAALTKQTAAVFLVAGALALLCSGRVLAAASLFGGGLLALVGVVAAMSAVEPNVVPS